ncbi:MAG: GerAB/ArcD/ProY family transporter [Clostridia bacterium]|nr:GerAB/ArcD/ProY family transporter [Clostridia bacterium]
MKTEMNVSFPFAVSVLSVFAVANGLLRAPFSGGSLWEFAAALIIGAALAPLFAALLTSLPENKKRRLLKAAAIPVSALLVFLAFTAADEYSRFVYAAVLPNADMWIIRLSFALCAVFLALSSDTALYKFAFLSFVLILFVFVLLFILSEKTFDFKNLLSAFPLSRFSFDSFAKYLYKMILPSLAAVLFLFVSDSGASAKKVLCGAALTPLLCLVPVLDSVLSFGLPLAAKLDYPYIDDISTVTAGSLFTRMDGFAYFAFFTAYIFKCAVCIKTATHLFGSIFPRRKANVTVV